MRKDDARKLNRDAQEALRIRAVNSVLAGESPELVASAIGINRTTIYDWLAKHRDGGVSSLKKRKAPGRTPKLDAKKRQWIFNLLTTKNPQQLKFEFALWTREMLQEIILEKYKIKLSLVSIGKLLADLGFTCQKPLYKAIQKNDTLVNEWVKKVFPKIKKRAVSEGADVFFADAAHIRSDHHAGKTWGIKGQTPVISSTGSRFSFSLISAITSKGHMRFMVTEGGVNSKVFIGFLKRLITGSTKKIFLVVDNGPAHVSKKTKDFVASVSTKLELFFLPPYSPDLNPDELVWNHLKNHTVGRSTVKDKNDFRKKVTRSMKSLQANRKKIKSFFEKDTLKYAA